MVMALTSGVSILRDRLDAHERLNAIQRLVTPGSIDDYVPDDAAQTSHAARRKRLIEKVCRPLLAADNAAEEPGDVGEDGDNSPVNSPEGHDA